MANRYLRKVLWKPVKHDIEEIIVHCIVAWFDYSSMLDTIKHEMKPGLVEVVGAV